MSAPDPLRAWQLLELHRPELALQVTEQLLAQDPTSVSALLARAEALRQLERLPEALSTAQAAVAQAPQSAGTFCKLAQVLGQQGKLQEAELTIQEAIRLNPIDAGYYGFLAQLYYLMRRPAEAFSSANAGLAVYARHPECLLWRAMAQEAQDRPEAADADFGRLLRIAPTSQIVHRRLGQVLLRRYEPHAADTHLMEALRQAPDQAPVLLPLLQQARWQSYWPAWLLRTARQEANERKMGLEPGGSAAFVAIVSPLFRLRSRWLTRHDPLFQLSRRQIWQRRLGLWLSLIIIIPVVILTGNYFGFFNAEKPLSILQMLALLGGGILFHLVIHLMSKKINS